MGSRKQKFQSVRGMRDLLPEDMVLWHEIEACAKNLLAQFSYEEIRLPLLEATGLFARTAGETSDIVAKEMYSFQDRGGDDLSLRPEGTAGCVRACIQHGLIRSQQRLWYTGPMFRYDRPQKGRYRAHTQIGVETFGVSGPELEAELLLLLSSLWQQLDVADALTLELNSIGDLADRARYTEALVAYLRTYVGDLDDDSRERLDRNPLRILDSKDERTRAILADAPDLSAYLGDESKEHFDELLRLLQDLGIKCTLNSRLVRGLDYYNRTVFEWTTALLGAQATVCAGGRYDGLVEQLGGPATPAAGFGMGLDRLVLVVDACRNEPASAGPDLYLAVMDPAHTALGMNLAQRLRAGVPGLQVRHNLGGGRMKAQMKRADNSGARYALILGEDEVRSGQYTIKDLRSDVAQEQRSEQELCELFASHTGHRTDS